MNYHVIKVDFGDAGIISSGLKFKQFDFGHDCLKFVLYKDGEIFNPNLDFTEAFIRVLRSDGRFDERKIWDVQNSDLSFLSVGSDGEYYCEIELSYFETFVSGVLSFELSFLKYDSSKLSYSQRVTSPRVNVEIYNSISSYNVIDKKNIDLFVHLLVEIKALQATVTYKEYIDKLDSIQRGANVNVQADWAEADPESDAFIPNKPNLEEMEDRLREEISLTNDVASNAESSADANKEALELHRANGDDGVNHLDDRRRESVEKLHLALNLVNSANPNVIANGSIGIGVGNTVSKSQVLCAGEFNVSGGYRNLLIGSHLIDKNESCRAIIGRYNVMNGQLVLVVGWGTSDDNRINIFTVDKNGNVVSKGNINCGGTINGKSLVINGEDMAQKIGKIEADVGKIDAIEMDLNTVIMDEIPSMLRAINNNADRLDELNAPPIMAVPTTLEANKAYNFGSQQNITIAFPSVANDGDVIYVGFVSRETTNLVVDTTNTYDFELIPEVNTGYEIYAKCNTDDGIPRWIVKYSEYTGVYE